MGVAICLSIDKKELLGEQKRVEARVKRGKEATTSPEGLSYPNSSVS